VSPCADRNRLLINGLAAIAALLRPACFRVALSVPKPDAENPALGGVVIVKLVSAASGSRATRH
jgi:hypothetical protein